MNNRREINLPCNLLAKSGRKPEDGVPFAWLETWVTELRAAIPAQEQGGCMVLGTQYLSARYDHLLTSEEALQAERDELLALLRTLRDTIRLDGSMSPAEQRRVSELLNLKG